MTTAEPPAVAPRPSLKRRLLRLLRVLAVTYLGISLVLLLLENSLVYFPTPASAGWWPPPSRDVRDVELTSADGTRLHAWWVPRPGGDGAVLCLNGNAGNLSHR